MWNIEKEVGDDAMMIIIDLLKGKNNEIFL